MIIPFLLDLLFPKRCVHCDRVGEYLCSRCAATVETVPDTDALCPVCLKPAYDGATHPLCGRRYAPDGLTSLFRYRGAVRSAVKAVKYRSVEAVYERLFHAVPLTSHNLKRAVDRFNISVIIPIPLHASRLRIRGFNQALTVAGIFSRNLGIPVGADLMIRRKPTRPQTELTLRELRLKNVRDAFEISASGRSKLRNSSVLLVDDVFTTGQTARDAAKALKRAGAHYVWIATVAR